MAKLTHTMKVKIFQQLNERELPWKDSRFVINEDELEWLGGGSFAEVYVMENVEDHSIKYAVKVIGLNDNKIHKGNIESCKNEPKLQYKLAEQCGTVVKIIDTEVISIQLDDKGNVEDVRLDDIGIEKAGWVTFVLIKMEKLSPVIDDDFSNTFSVQIPALKTSVDEILSLAIDIAKALDASHSMKVMHRDVKLENIFYDESKNIYKLGDFGIARITNQDSASTRGAGTVGYEAPEVVGGDENRYSYQADIYSFGVTIYLLLNELKYPGSSDYHVNRGYQYDPKTKIEPPKLGTMELKRYICSLISFYPQNRPQSMREVLEHLNAIREKSSGKRKTGETENSNVEPHMIGADEEELEEETFETDYDEEDLNKADSDEETFKKSFQEDALNEEPLNMSFDRITSEEKHTKEKVAEYGNSVGSIPTEVKKQSSVEKKVKSPSYEKSNYKSQESYEFVTSTVEKGSKHGVTKGIFGMLCMIIGLAYFAFLSGENFQILDTQVASWSLLTNTIISFIAVIMNFAKKKKMPYIIWFILFCFSIYVMVTEVVNWFYIVVAASLLIGGSSEIFAVNLSAWVYLLAEMHWGNQLDSIVTMNLAWIFFALTLVGLSLCEQVECIGFNSLSNNLSFIFGDALGELIGTPILIAGIVCWILNRFTSVNVPELLMEMHFIYVGVILWVFTFINLSGLTEN